MVSLVCDSSALISLADTCNIEALYFAKEKLGAGFLIPPLVYEEAIARPLKIWRYELSAVRLRKAFEDKVLSLLDEPGLEEEAGAVLAAANRLFEVDGGTLEVLHGGEAQCLAALALVPGAALVVDEKTTRLLVESPDVLLEALKPEYAGEIKFNEEALGELRSLAAGVRVLRSSEVLAVVAGRGYFDAYGGAKAEAFRASLYAAKSAGCSVSFEELKEYSGMELKEYSGMKV